MHLGQVGRLRGVLALEKTQQEESLGVQAPVDKHRRSRNQERAQSSCLGSIHNNNTGWDGPSRRILSHSKLFWQQLPEAMVRLHLYHGREHQSSVKIFFQGHALAAEQRAL